MRRARLAAVSRSLRDIEANPWARANAETRRGVIAVLVRTVELWVNELITQILANTAWTFATANHRDEKLFVALARAAEERLSEFNAQGVATTAWAFATANHRDEKPFAALARAAERHLGEFNAQGLANAAWALATVKDWQPKKTWQT